ncbi:MAG: hypothetical protein Q4F72_00495 [Desulfovibrionaceae bacterium]|nr:hypothetical protein [Desulfovibrionaceae bacterium]
MRRFYQESWQGIPFTDFAHTHFFHLADARFYSVFYEQLFRRYQTWDDLPETWRKNKAADAAWLADRLRARQKADPDGTLRVLSIGSGVGYMERMLIREMHGAVELYVNEPSTVCMKWLRRLIPADRIFIGQPPDCLSPDISYDMIYLSAVDYGIPQAQLEHTLEMLRYMLRPGGEIICLSASLLEEEGPVAGFVNFAKNCLRGVLHYIGIRRQQFWGWRRTRSEYLDLFRSCGFRGVQDGWLDDGFNTYWIRGTADEAEAGESAGTAPVQEAGVPAQPAPAEAASAGTDSAADGGDAPEASADSAERPAEEAAPSPRA